MMDEQRNIEEFERLVTGSGGVADDELAGLFLLARGVAASPAAHRLQAPVVRPEFRSALRTQLVQQASGAVPLALHRRVRASVQARDAHMRRSLRSVVAVAAAALVMIVGGALVAGAQNALPGDALYGVKMARENLALKAVRGRVPHANRELELARERVAEVRGLLQRNTPESELYVGALDNMDRYTLDATKLLIIEYRTTKNLDVLRALVNFSIAQRQDLASVSDSVPPAARPKVRSSIELVSAVQNRVSDVLAGCPCSENPLAPVTTQLQGSSQTPACSCKAKTPAAVFGQAPSAQKPTTTKPSVRNPGSPDQPGTGDDGNRILPDVPGTDVDNTVDDVIDDLLKGLGVGPSPSASPILPLPSL